jgi:hypothetical protein
VQGHASNRSLYLNLELERFPVFAPAALMAGKDARAPGFGDLIFS